jgi:hypothetical protein
MPAENFVTDIFALPGIVVSLTCAAYIMAAFYAV